MKMEKTIFAKKRTSKDGKKFYSYLTKLVKSDGTEIPVAVKFRDECGNPSPSDCPMNIRFEKADANLTTREYVREDTGEIGQSNTLWVSKWEKGSDYVDHSLDDFD